MREIFIIKKIFSVLADVSLKYGAISDGLDISKTETPETAAQIKYKGTANGVEITEIISEIDGNGAEMSKEICEISVISFYEDISNRTGIYEESEEL